MNCREGDQALIVGGSRRDLVGKEVAVLYPAYPNVRDPAMRRHGCGSEPSWMVEFKDPIVIWAEDNDGSLFEVDSFFGVIADRYLRPLNGRPEPEKVETGDLQPV
jgi:hypothetical protein